jgi:hypothetical protein
VGEAREDLGEGLPGVLARGDGAQPGVRVGEEQARQFLPGVTGRAHDGDFLRVHPGVLFTPAEPAAQRKISKLNAAALSGNRTVWSAGFVFRVDARRGAGDHQTA